MFFSSSFCDNFLDLSVTDPDESGSEILYLVVEKTVLGNVFVILVLVAYLEKKTSHL